MMWTQCDGTEGACQPVPFPAVVPKGLKIPDGDHVTVAKSNDTDNGFLKIKVSSDHIDGTLFTACRGTPGVFDSFQLDRRTHNVRG